MGIVIGLIFLVSYILYGNQKKYILKMLSIVITTAAIFFYSVIYYGIENYRDTFLYMSQLGGGKFYINSHSVKFLEFIFMIENVIKRFYLFYSVLILLIFIKLINAKKNIIWRDVLLALLPLSIILSFLGNKSIREGISGVLFSGFIGPNIAFSSLYIYLMFSSLPALIYLCNLEKVKKIRFLIFFFIIPAIAGLITSIFSVNGFMALIGRPKSFGSESNGRFSCQVCH
jgi:hypothetical protein